MFISQCGVVRLLFVVHHLAIEPDSGDLIDTKPLGLLLTAGHDRGVGVVDYIRVVAGYIAVNEALRRLAEVLDAGPDIVFGIVTLPRSQQGLYGQVRLVQFGTIERSCHHTYASEVDLLDHFRSRLLSA